jgi:hypothetical protein
MAKTHRSGGLFPFPYNTAEEAFADKFAKCVRSRGGNENWKDLALQILADGWYKLNYSKVQNSRQAEKREYQRELERRIAESNPEMLEKLRADIAKRNG